MKPSRPKKRAAYLEEAGVPLHAQAWQLAQYG